LCGAYNKFKKTLRGLARGRSSRILRKGRLAKPSNELRSKEGKAQAKTSLSIGKGGSTANNGFIAGDPLRPPTALSQPDPFFEGRLVAKRGTDRRNRDP